MRNFSSHRDCTDAPMVFDTALKKQLLTGIWKDCILPDPKRLWDHPRMAKPMVGYDGSYLLHQAAHGRKGFHPSISYYNAMMRKAHHHISVNGTHRACFAFDKGVPIEKLATIQERRSRREETKKKESEDHKHKTVTESKHAAAVDDDDTTDDDDVEYTSTVVHKPYDKNCHFDDGCMLRFAYDPKTNQSVAVECEEEVNLEWILDDREGLRAEFIMWVIERMVDDSRRFPATEVIVDFTKDRTESPVVIRGGQCRLWTEGVNDFLEGEHSLVTLRNHFPNDHALIVANDGDNVVVHLLAVAQQRRKSDGESKWTEQRPIASAHENSGYWVDKSTLDTPVAAVASSDDPDADFSRFGGGSTESHTVVYWAAYSHTEKEDLSVYLSINDALSRLINSKIHPSALAVACLFGKNDYIKKAEVTHRMGNAAIWTWLSTPKHFKLTPERTHLLNNIECVDDNKAQTQFFEILCEMFPKAKTNKAMSFPWMKTLVIILRRWKACGTPHSASAPSSNHTLVTGTVASATAALTISDDDDDERETNSNSIVEQVPPPRPPSPELI
jgi:hypothetical protein